MQGLSEPKAVTSTNTKHLSNMNTLVRRYKTNIYSNQLDVQSFFLQRIVGELFFGNMWKRRKMSFPRLSSPSLPTTSTWTVRPTSIDRWTFNKNKPDKRSFTTTFDFLCYFNTPQYINIWRSNSIGGLIGNLTCDVPTLGKQWPMASLKVQGMLIKA